MNYIVLLDHIEGKIIKIKLSDREKELEPDILLYMIQDKYSIDIKGCTYILVDKIEELEYENS